MLLRFYNFLWHRSSGKVARNTEAVSSCTRRSKRSTAIFFFFSSRRRHTRLTCDWSSDVCSSDLLVSLGIWQLERKAWKEGLIARIEARAYGPPGALAREADWPSWSAAGDEFRRVRLTGTFRHELEVQLHGLARLRDSAIQGYYVFTPLTLDTGATAIVNRGFVPTELRDPAARAAGQVAGQVTVTGLVRAPEAGGWFLPPNDPGRNEWFVRSVADMARAHRLERVAPFYV